MIFRAAIHDQQYMKEFHNTVLTLSKLTKECVMIISEDTVHFIINEESTSAAPLVWTEISCATYFDEYAMKGVDSEHPNILLSFNPANLARALAALKNIVVFVKLKLTNKQFPCLTVEIEISSLNTVQTRRIVHDVPINLIPRREWDSYQLPKPPDCHVVLTMPNLRFIRNLIDKIKNLSPSITLCATSAGGLSIVAETDSATIASHYRNLEVKKVDREEFDKNLKVIEVGCVIDCKKLAIFLSALQQSNLQLTCGIILDHFIHMEIEVRQGMNMNCVIPAVCV